MTTPVVKDSDSGVVLTAPEPDKGASLKLPQVAGPVPQPALVDKVVVNVEKTSPDSGYVNENPTDKPYLVEAGSALTIGGGQGPGVSPGYIQGRQAGRYVPDFAADLDNDSVSNATKEAVKAVEDSQKAQGLKP